MGLEKALLGLFLLCCVEEPEKCWQPPLRVEQTQTVAMYLGLQI